MKTVIDERLKFVASRYFCLYFYDEILYFSKENERVEDQRSKNDIQKQSSLKNSKLNEKRASQALNTFRKYAKHVMTAGDFSVNFPAM